MLVKLTAVVRCFEPAHLFHIFNPKLLEFDNFFYASVRKKRRIESKIKMGKMNPQLSMRSQCFDG